DLFGSAPLMLQRVRLVAPRLVLAQTPALVLVGLGAAGFAAALSLDGIMVSDGNLIVEQPGRRALVARDVMASVDRASGAGESDAAFAVETVLYGTSVRITGQPAGRGAYALRVRASGLDAPALLEDFPQALAVAGIRLVEGRADVDATFVVSSSRVLASGQFRIDHLVARFAESRSVPLTASALIVAVDRWDLAAGTGRISRLGPRGPTPAGEGRTPGADSAPAGGRGPARARIRHTARVV